MALLMNKRRNVPLRNAVLILFRNRHLLISWWCRKAKTDFILLYSFLYSLSSTADTFQPSSVLVYSSHSFLMHGIFFLFIFLCLSPVLIRFLSRLRYAIVIVMSWVSPDGRVSQTSPNVTLHSFRKLHICHESSERNLDLTTSEWQVRFAQLIFILLSLVNAATAHWHRKRT
jgi:hypothetical protein